MAKTREEARLELQQRKGLAAFAKEIGEDPAALSRFRTKGYASDNLLRKLGVDVPLDKDSFTPEGLRKAADFAERNNLGILNFEKLKAILTLIGCLFLIFFMVIRCTNMHNLHDQAKEIIIE